MLKYSLLDSIQAGPFSNQNKMIDIEVFESLVMNPSQSFIQLTTSLEGIDVPAGTQPTDVFNIILTNTSNDNIPILNTDLIRNCWLSGAKVGKLENVRRSNVLRHNLIELTKSSSRLKSQVDSLYQINDYVNHQILSPFVEMHKEGSIPSRYINQNLRIPLSDLFELGSLQALDTSKTGKLTLHLELENLDYVGNGVSKLFTGMNDEGILNNVTAVTAQFTTKSTYPSLDYSPFYVGQPLLLDYTPYNGGTAGTPVQDVNTTVTALSYSSKTKLITITLSVGVTFQAPNTNVRAIQLKEILQANYPTASFSINSAQLGVCEIMGKIDTPDDIGYMTWTTEEYSSGGQNYINKIFEIESNAVNALFMFDNNSANLTSNNTYLSSYRMRCDNVDIYDRDIIVNKSNTSEDYIHDTLHYDSLIRTFKNMGKPLKNLSLTATGVTDELLTDRLAEPQNQIMILACPTPVTASTKQLQINAVSSAAINNVILFKQVFKMLKL